MNYNQYLFFKDQFSIINELKNGFSTDIIKKLQYKKGAPVDIVSKNYIFDNETFHFDCILFFV